ncbi:hypothetical protein EYR41_006991 [Orbilia oligospora]|uniref:Uncharacterized protein n=1 Tax=Orbilia oligospora TaxID=2813651 RepID=A0A8H2DVH4_ORBOL|nr:hypothetical protein EYR41_006991 [Orbilia oligospora]
MQINYIEGIESKSKSRVSFLRRFDYAPIPNPRKRTPYDCEETLSLLRLAELKQAALCDDRAAKNELHTIPRELHRTYCVCNITASRSIPSTEL